MTKITKTILQLTMLAPVCLMISCSDSSEITYTNVAAPIEDRVDDLLARMTIEEKVSQMRMFHQNQGIEFSGTGELELSDYVKQSLLNGIGGIKNPGEHLFPEHAASLNNRLQKVVVENNRLGIPAFFVTESYNGVDAEGSTRFGRPITLSSSWNSELVAEVYDTVGREARLRGLHLTHSPVADIARDPRFGRMSEGFGEDTWLATEMVVSHANHWLLTDVLRDQWGFEGYTVSDSNDIARLHSFMKIAETPEDAVMLGLNAGIDVDLYSGEAYSLLPEMVRKNPNLEALIDRSARRVLRTKFILGLFDDPYQDPSEAGRKTRNVAAIALAHKADLESIILLKNSDRSLPLIEGSQKTIALVGPLLGDKTLQAFEEIAGDQYEFITEKGFDLTNGNRSIPQLTPVEVMREGIREIVNATQESDVIILFLGGDQFTSKEAFFGSALGDRDSIDPVGLQDELLIELKKTGKPVVVVLQYRRTLSINTIANDDGWHDHGRG